MRTETIEVQVPEADQMETWEVQVDGRVVVWKKNRRTGEYTHAHVDGTRGPKLLHISEDDRVYNQELIPEENNYMDPFTNGALAQRQNGELVGITADDLAEYLEIEEDEPFRELLADMDNELTVRRLLEIAESDGTMTQVEAIRDRIDEQWRVGGTQPTVEEMLEEGDSKGEQIS